MASILVLEDEDSVNRGIEFSCPEKDMRFPAQSAYRRVGNYFGTSF